MTNSVPEDQGSLLIILLMEEARQRDRKLHKWPSDNGCVEMFIVSNTV